MALWNALAPAATVAQLVGADAAGLVSATLQAVRTARRNRGECRSLARRVMMLGDLLQLVQQGSTETMRRPEVRRALDGLGDVLRRAYELVESCQERGAVYGFVMAGRQAEQFREVQADIDSYLVAFPMVSHIDVTIRLDRIYNMLLPPDQSQQALEAVPGSPTSHLGPFVRALADTMKKTLIKMSKHKIIDCDIKVCVDHQETFEKQLLSRDQRLKMKWLCWLPQQNAEDRSAYDLLKAATNNFSSRNRIGVGGWSTVYKAHIGGIEVAIKRYPADAKSHASQFDSEFQILKELQHKNIIKLLGHCAGQGERILVYEYMSNGSLDKFIFDVRLGCIGHKDLKPSNILLDSDMNAKISDFGTATVLRPEFPPGTTYITGTYGYIAPEYLRNGILSPKVDVYAYGVILLEVISAKKSSVPWLQAICCGYFTIKYKKLAFDYFLLPMRVLLQAWHLWATMRSSELLDPLLCNVQPITDITRCIQIALLCVQTHPADRPSMSDVLLMLGNRMTIPSPKQPDDEYQTDGHEYQLDGYESEATWSSSDITWPR
ncbi:hypothetical protein EJB05_49741, partial [Eragrostis curvula]